MTHCVGQSTLGATAGPRSGDSSGRRKSGSPGMWTGAGARGHSRPFSSHRDSHIRGSRKSSGDFVSASSGGFAAAGVSGRKRTVLFLLAGSVAASATAASSASAEPSKEPAKPAADTPKGLGGMCLVSGSALMPRPDKVATGGEDAFFIAPDGASVGVADGVGGWSEVGVDPALHSRMLMANTERYCRELSRQIREEQAEPAPTASAAAPAAAVPAAPSPAAGEASTSTQEMHERVLNVLVKANEKTRVMGSSTACFVFLRGSTLHGCNLGDSGFLIIRDEKIFFKSPSQQHAFNFPYQLGSEETDSPFASDLFDIPVVKGDIVLLATDGVWDNVFDEEICRIVTSEFARGGGPQSAAERVANAAQLRGADTKTMTPFAVSAANHKLRYRGGKPDDVTVVVSVVTEAPGGVPAAAPKSKL